MNPKEKALELVEKYKELQITTLGCGDGNPCIIKNTMIYNSAKQCALIAVDEMLNEMAQFAHLIEDTKWTLLQHTIDSKNHYWQQVKTEIEKLIK